MTKRRFPKSILPYLDQDYIDKLSDIDKAWLEEFNLAYYLGEPVNNKEGQGRKRLAKRDLLANSESPTSPKINAPNRYYTPQDYVCVASVVSFADALIVEIDRDKQAKVIDIERGQKNQIPKKTIPKKTD